MSSQSDSLLTKTVIFAIVAIIITSAVLIPIVDTASNGTSTAKISISNAGDPFASPDGDTHIIEIGLDGDYYTVSTDGTRMRALERAEDVTATTNVQVNPFNLYYAALNLSSGDNADDSGETRLSKEKGAVAYVLNPNNLRQTINGYTFDPTLYNVMLVIPPVYWYSDGTDKLYVASSPDAFSGLTLKDYAHTYTSNGETGHTDAIAIGVYEGYSLGNVLVSQADRTPTPSLSYTQWVGRGGGSYTVNDNCVYRMWDYFDWTLYKIMCWVIMGNTDSQYMMGDGPVSMSASSVTGLTTSAIQKAPDNQSSVSLLLENTWGSMGEFVGNVSISSQAVLTAGNSLTIPTELYDIVNVLEESVTMPYKDGVAYWYYDTMNTSSDVFGTLLTGSISPVSVGGQGINDQITLSSNSPISSLSVGGHWNTKQNAGLSYFVGNESTVTKRTLTCTRLACTFTDTPQVPVQTADYAYILTYNNSNGVTITDVQSRDNGVLTSRMPTGTTLNSYWDFGRSTTATVTAPQDFLSPDVSSTVISLGGDNIAMLYSNGFVRVYKEDGYDTTARITADNPLTLTVTDSVAYDDGNGAFNTAPVSYFVGEGEYVLTANGDGELLSDTPIAYFSPYVAVDTDGGVTVYIGYVGFGTVSDVSTVALAPSDASYVGTETAVDIQDSGDTVSDVQFTFKTDWGADGYSELQSDNVILPKQVDATRTETDTSLTGTILGVVPIFVILGIIIYVVQYIRTKPDEY